MNSSLPIFAFLAISALDPLVGFAQAPAPATNNAAGQTQAPPGSDAAEGLVRRVLAEVDAQMSIAAKVRFKVNLLGETRLGSGIYRQQGRGEGRLLRLDLELKNTNQQASRVRQICDGQLLWILDEQGDEKSLAKIDLARLRAAKPKTPTNPSSTAWLALGGLPKLLANLDASFRFSSVTQSRLGELSVWTLDGAWEPSVLAKLLPDEREAIETGKPTNLNKLAKNLPDRAVIHVGCDDLFPYRFEYWRSSPPSKNASADDRGTLLFVMEFYEVQTQSPIDRGEFVFDAGTLTPTDRTTAFLEKLGLEEALPAGAKPSAATRR